MSFPVKIAAWLESRWIAPAYVGWVLMGLTVFFFAAATNTLAGWLYVMSGVLLALLVIAALLPPRNLSGLQIRRRALRPVSVGETLLVELLVENQSPRPKTLLQLQDHLPEVFASQPQTAIASLGPGATHRWAYEVIAPKRGIYHWQQVDMRTAAPLGLFWCRRHHQAKAVAIIYPQILPLRRCPILDSLGADTNRLWHQELSPRPANEGLTRALRPYRWGDPIRLIHWRTSARYNDLRVRELEQITSGHHITVALNTADLWTETAFEQAVIAAASLFVYGSQQNYSVALWTPATGSESQRLAALSTLAAIQSGAAPTAHLPAGALLWLTMAQVPARLGAGSHVISWGQHRQQTSCPHHWIDSHMPLQGQLQALT